MECQKENEGRTLVITNETNFDTVEANFDEVNVQYDVVKFSNVNIDDAFMEQLHQKNLNIDLIRLENIRCSFTPRILDEILDRSILDLVVTNCELHILDICAIMNAFNGNGYHEVDLSKSKIAWNEGLDILDKEGPSSIYKYRKSE